MKLSLRKVYTFQIYDGVKVPWHWGYSYRDYYCKIVVWHIVPFNYFVRIWRRIKLKWDELRNRETYLDKQVHAAIDEYREKVLPGIVEWKLRQLRDKE